MDSTLGFNSEGGWQHCISQISQWFGATMLIGIVSHDMSLSVLGIVFKCFGWVVPRHNFGLNLYQTKSGASFLGGGWWYWENFIGLNLYQDKSGVISFFRPEKNVSVWICIKLNLVLSHFGWVGGWSPEKISVWICIESNLVLSHFGGSVPRKKLYQAKFGVIWFLEGRGVCEWPFRRRD